MKFLLKIIVLMVVSINSTHGAPLEEVRFEPDKDSNGVRDDIDALIAEQYGVETDKSHVATTYARLLQEIAYAWYDEDKAKATSLERDLVLACWSMVSSRNLEDELLPYILNTYNVSKAYLLAMQKGFTHYSDVDVYIENNKAGYCAKFGEIFSKSTQSNAEASAD